jgi:hypothetical protein
MLSEHLTSEYFIKTDARGRSVDEWKQRPEQPDNHWFDCLVGAAVAASMQGATLPEFERKLTRAPRVSFRELQKNRQGGAF